MEGVAIRGEDQYTAQPAMFAVLDSLRVAWYLEVYVLFSL